MHRPPPDNGAAFCKSGLARASEILRNPQSDGVRDGSPSVGSGGRHFAALVAFNTFEAIVAAAATS